MRWLAAALALSLAGCGLLARREPAPSPASAPAKGGYYKDDGPGASPPANLDALPDAQPRIEPLNRFANRPYEAFGREYVPMTALGPFHQRGIASWYGKRYHGGPTSSGEPYDMYAMTAAHPTLPIPSYARVTRADGTRSVVVRVNDRGPFRSDRAIDLSYAAAHRLGIIADGSALVDIEAVVQGPDAAAAAAPSDEAKGVYLQLGAFSARESAENFRDRLQRELAWLPQAIRVIAGDSLYRLRLGPFRSPEEARPVAERIRGELDVSPLIVVR